MEPNAEEGVDRTQDVPAGASILTIQKVKVIHSSFSIAESDSNGSSTTTRGRRRYRRRRRLNQFQQRDANPTGRALTPTPKAEVSLESAIVEVTISNTSLLSKSATDPKSDVSSLSSHETMGSNQSIKGAMTSAHFVPHPIVTTPKRKSTPGCAI